jgi:hypothetical protein
MNRYSFLLLFTIFSFSCIISCKKEYTSELTDFQYSYFPTSKGYCLVYDVTSITIDDTMNIFDTVRYQLKEKFDSVYTDNTGNSCWRIERYTRNNNSLPWVITTVILSQITSKQLQQVEENQRIIKIVFPPKVGNVWNANTMNSLESKEYEIETANVPDKINNFHFDSTLKIVTENSSSLINKYYSFNKYANHIGLVGITKINIDQAKIIYNLPIEQRISIGTQYYQTLKEYYHE